MQDLMAIFVFPIVAQCAQVEGKQRAYVIL